MSKLWCSRLGLGVFGVLFLASCGEAVEDDAALTNEDDGAVIAQAITKAQDPTANGDKDFCNDNTARCASGEGDCDADAQCEAGLVCGVDNGAQFGFARKWDVCVPAHCQDGQVSGDEVGKDCGGSCGVCVNNKPVGDKDYCTIGLPCSQGQGDCDADAQCQPGLICKDNNGAQFGLPANYDVCVADTCRNGVQDGDEAGIDCGGPTCGGTCSGGVMPPATECLIISEYVEGSSNNKALELLNCGNVDVDLSQYSLCLYSNAATTCTPVALSGTLSSGQTHVTCNTSSVAAIKANCQLQSNSIANFNGDDRVALLKGMTVVDAFGELTVRPGSIWANKTLRRCTLTPYLGVGSFDYTQLYSEFASDTFDGLGKVEASDCQP